MTDREKLIEILESAESAFYWDSNDNRNLTYTKHDIARRIQTVIDWQRWQILFPLLRDYWNK